MLFSEMVAKAASCMEQGSLSLDLSLARLPWKVKHDFQINKLCYNSKHVEPNDIFFAVKGSKLDGDVFIGEAAAKGAKAIISDRARRHDDLSPVYTVDNVRKTMAVFSNIFYDFPSRKMSIIGVTGTNGKTTVSSIINHVLKSVGKKTGLIGTNKYLVGSRELEASHTTPESVDLNALLFTMIQENVEFVTMEVSSHSLSLYRVHGMDWDTAAFTNLTPEHLDFHHDMAAYFRAKKILFDSMPEINAKGHAAHVVYNMDDKYGGKIIEDTKAKTVSYGFHNADYTAANVSMLLGGMTFDLVSLEGSVKIKTNLTGRFNAYNILCAFASLKQYGISSADIVLAIESFPPVEGRFNVFNLSNGAYAIVDYAHTPDSLYNALITIREIGAKRVITVFGCGGDRDKTKRPVMGEIAAKFSDAVIITTDNPRFEEPMDIINDITTGIKSNNYFVEEDRQAAIAKAIEMSHQGDVILVAGKGHEAYQETRGIRHHLSDIEIVLSF
jgi:UDP-N-acetylmuramoyl-L-alanyl-D-glutamate--2,6-diaminopimelate ligase